jgi:2-dehydropantoate 2-reductase
VGAALVRSGAGVVLLMRPESLVRYSGRMKVESVALGEFEVDVPASGVLDDPIDVLWVTTKATQLESALALAAPDAVGDARVIPLLNGVDHLALLRRRYPIVVAAAIRVESERIAPGVIRQSWPFLRVDIAGAPDVQAELRNAGFECRPRDDERTLLWEKLVFLAPGALATTAFDGPLGAVRKDALFVGCREEAFSAARAASARIDEGSITASHEAAPAELRSSMQKDVAAGREPELDAIAGPISRSGRKNAFPTECTDRLVAQIHVRLSSLSGITATQ